MWSCTLEIIHGLIVVVLVIAVHTYIDGLIASAATFLFLAGKKRFMTENSNILIHQISTGFWGKFEDLKDEYKNTTELMKRVVII